MATRFETTINTKTQDVGQLTSHGRLVTYALLFLVSPYGKDSSEISDFE